MPSSAAPIPFALYSIMVPDGSVWYMEGPLSSTPAINKATPYGLDMGFLRDEGSPYPKLRARSEIVCVSALTVIG